MSEAPTTPHYPAVTPEHIADMEAMLKQACRHDYRDVEAERFSAIEYLCACARRENEPTPTVDELAEPAIDMTGAKLLVRYDQLVRGARRLERELRTAKSVRDRALSSLRSFDAKLADHIERQA